MVQGMAGARRLDELPSLVIVGKSAVAILGH